MIEVGLPIGTVTLLFTDIEGSTRMLRSLGDRYGGVLQAHRRILREAVAGHGGVEFGTEGDACFLAFGSAAGALAAAADAQRALAAADWPGEADLRVRMGVHTGAPVVVDGDYVGLDVHRAARISSAAHGGQVLVSAATREAAGAGNGLALRDLGHHRLKDLDRPEHLFQLLAAGLAEDFPPPRSLPTPSNLPAVPTSFVGREAELAEAADLLARPGVRLLTLTGPGGAGKTRLAVEAARGLAPRFPDGCGSCPWPVSPTRPRFGLDGDGDRAADGDGPVDGLETLVEHSLVERQETATPARFRMLATIREYAEERLEQAGEREGLRRRHAKWFAEQAQAAYLRIDSEDQMASLAWFNAEMANVRATLAWTLERPQEPERVALALSLVRSLGYLWYTRGLTREALSWLDQIAAVADGAPPDQRGVLLYWLGAFATRQGRAEQAAAAYTEAFILANLGDLAFEEGDLDGARELLERSIELLEPRGDRWATAVIQRYLAKVLAAQGERPRAYALVAETLSVLRAWAERAVRLLAGAAAIRDAAAGEAAGGRAMTFDQVLDYAAAWADRQRKGAI